MAYADGGQLYQWFGTGATLAVEVEATADILFFAGRLADAGTGSTAALDSLYFPNGGTIQAFGVTITEAITNTNTTRNILKVKYVSVHGAAATDALAITIPNATDGIAGQGTTAAPGTILPSSATLAQANAVGARIICPSVSTTAGVPSSTGILPFRCVPGSNVYLEVTTAGGAAGGAYIPWLIVRHDSLVAPATSASPVSKAYTAA